MKRIQEEWKQVGHVPRRHSDKVWNDFKKACNHYFDRLHASKNESNKEENQALEGKKSFLDNLREFTLSGNQEADIEALKKLGEDWKRLGRVPFNKKKH